MLLLPWCQLVQLVFCVYLRKATVDDDVSFACCDPLSMKKLTRCAGVRLQVVHKAIMC